MSISYALVPFECYGGSKVPLYLIALVALGLTALGGLISLVNWRKVVKGRGHDFDGDINRSRFMAALGMLSSGMFFVVIVAQGLATLVLHPCLL
jgi:hypothetical protein